MAVRSDLGHFPVIFSQMTAGNICDPARSVGVDFSSRVFHLLLTLKWVTFGKKMLSTCRRVVSAVLQCLICIFRAWACIYFSRLLHSKISPSGESWVLLGLLTWGESRRSGVSSSRLSLAATNPVLEFTPVRAVGLLCLQVWRISVLLEKESPGLLRVCGYSPQPPSSGQLAELSDENLRVQAWDVLMQSMGRFGKSWWHRTSQ